MKKTWLIILVIVIIVILGFYLSSNKSAEEMVDDDTTSGLRVEDNAVVVLGQKPGTTVTVNQVFLAAPGYAVVHEDNNGEAGAIIGTSALLTTGESNTVVITLNRQTIDRETLYVMLHFEKSGNGTFNPTTDTPVPSILGGSIMGSFEISKDAEENVEVTI